ncbi:hypothetical protein LXL04_002535 [Taraxacum kok-saghyz]
MPSSGRSGGLLNLWDSTIYNVEDVIKAKHFLITIGTWANIPGHTIIANVYGPHSPQEKKTLWEELIQIKSQKAGTWIILGDFNTVRTREERYNSQFYSSTAFWFNRFIDRSGLIDIRMGGRRYTYFCQSDPKMSKLDRYLACPNFIHQFPTVSVIVLPRELSDHCPIVLQTGASDFGKPPFRFFNSWLKRDGFGPMVNGIWNNFRGYGAPDAYLAAKLRYLKTELKKWRASDFPKEEEELKKAKERLSDLDMAADQRVLSEIETTERRDSFQKIAEIEKMKTMDLKQRSRIKWAVDGDENTRFFHGYVNNKKRANRIDGLVINGQWNTNAADIKQETFNFFQMKFKEKWKSRPKLISSKFNTLDPDVSKNLEKPFTVEEIKNAVWMCGNEKSPGPDGFTFKFIKNQWETIKEDIIQFVKFFERHGRLDRGCNSSFVTLIPKIKDPLKLGDYRPISLIGCLYKIIAKSLANRVKKVIGSTIEEVQSAYVEGRNIQDGPLIVNELCSWAKATKNKILLFKVDFEKAFDSINWEYLDSLLLQMGYGEKWRMWMKGCLNSGRASVDERSKGERNFHGDQGLKVNFSKSRVFGIGAEDQEILRWAAPLGCEIATLPFTYLGVPVGANMNLKKYWKPVIERVQTKLSSWKAQNLSLGGRLTLTKAVLGSLPSYFFSIFVAPLGVINTLEKIRRHFLWGGGGLDGKKKISWVAWDKVVAPKDLGGLGVGSLKAFNISLIVKWWWRLRENDQTLWSRVIRGIHNLKRKPEDVMSKKSITGVWNNIARIKEDMGKIGISMEEVMVKDIGVGDKTIFWLDKWCGDSRLKEDYKNLYQIEKHKQCLLKDRVHVGGFNWEWKTNLLKGTQVTELVELMGRIEGTQRKPGSDKWRSTNTEDGQFHIKDLQYILDSSTQIESGDTMIQWTQDIPIKVVCMVWRANLGRLPTASALITRGIPIESPICSLCSNEEEDALHTLWRCSSAQTTWYWIFQWCDISIPVVNEIGDLIQFINAWGNNKNRRRTLVSICYGTLWMIWKARCDWVFKKRRISPTKVADNIKSTVYTWLKYRRPNYTYGWEQWKPRTTGVKPGCIASSWDRTPDLPKEAKVDTHLIWKLMCTFIVNGIKIETRKMLPRESDGRKGDNGGWTEVRRRKMQASKDPPGRREDGLLTSFYVCNLPGDANKQEIREKCKKTGTLEDVYLAGRRNAVGSFFAFLKFSNVDDAAEVEKALNDIHIRGRKLKANRAKHPRRPTMEHRNRVPTKRGGIQHQVGQKVYRVKDVRTFADAAKGVKPSPVKPPLVLNSIKEVAEWSLNATLVGEAKSFDMLCSLPSLIGMEGYDILETKYLGGMQVIIKFKSDKAAKVFRANKCIWSKWFTWVEANRSRPGGQERIAWVKIVGIPLHAWDEDNLHTVASSYGKVLVNASPFWGNKDISHGKLCILTPTLKKLNEELTILIGTEEFKIGIYEVDDNWMPFRSFESSPVSDSDDEMDDDDGISDTFDRADEEAEEGEFIPETNQKSSPAMTTVPEMEASSDATPGRHCSVHVPRREDREESPGESSNACETNTAVVTTPTRACQSGLRFPGKKQTGLPQQGLGPNSRTSGSPTAGPEQGSSPEFEFGDSDAKRRRTKKKAIRPSQTCRSPNQSHRRTASHSLDLNRVISGSRNSGDGSPTASCSNSREFKETIAIGNEVGFQIEDGDMQNAEGLRGVGVKKTRLPDVPVNISDWWGDANVGFEFVNSVGLSGGLMTFWDNSLFQLVDVIRSRNFLALVGYWAGIAGETILVNVYAPQPPREKRDLWAKIQNLMISRPGTWVVFGDFNAVRRPEERLNSVFCPRTAADFNRFILNSGLVDLNLGGRKFTYFCEDGCKHSKLDRILVCASFLANYPNSSLLALPREHSDHSPILLRTSFMDFGAIPFRFFNSWLERDDFEVLVKDAWTSFEGMGAPDRLLADKLKHVKEKIKTWRRECYDKERNALREMRGKVNQIELDAEDRSLTEAEISERRELKQKILRLEGMAKADLMQKAKAKWISDGDENSRFFHNTLKSKNRKCTLNGLMINGRWSSDVNEIKNEALNFFSDKFQEGCQNRPKFINNSFLKLSEADKNFLEASFGIGEVKEAIWSCGSDKAPGPDGFNFNFIKKFWDLMKDDIMRFVKHFEDFGCLSRGSNSSFITLLPKVKDPLTFQEFRPISLIGCVYKILSKCLANRIRRFIGSVIGEMQTAFIKGRNILDGPLIANEMYAWAKRSKCKAFLFKVDFDKAFDSINWGYLDSVTPPNQYGGNV